MSHFPYRREGDTWQIDLQLESLQQLSSDLDPAPLARRDLDSSAEEYILDAARELPQDAKLCLNLWLPGEELALANAERVTRTVRYHFQWMHQRSRHKLREHLREANRSTILGLVFMVVCMLIVHSIESMAPPDHLMTSISAEGLMVIGWVALWRPVEMLLYDWWPLRREVKLTRRLAGLDVQLCAQENYSAELPELLPA